MCVLRGRPISPDPAQKQQITRVSARAFPVKNSFAREREREREIWSLVKSWASLITSNHHHHSIIESPNLSLSLQNSFPGRLPVTKKHVRPIRSRWILIILFSAVDQPPASRREKILKWERVGVHVWTHVIGLAGHHVSVWPSQTQNANTVMLIVNQIICPASAVRKNLNYFEANN